MTSKHFRATSLLAALIALLVGCTAAAAPPSLSDTTCRGTGCVIDRSYSPRIVLSALHSLDSAWAGNHKKCAGLLASSW